MGDRKRKQQLHKLGRRRRCIAKTHVIIHNETDVEEELVPNVNRTLKINMVDEDKNNDEFEHVRLTIKTRDVH